MSARPHSFTGPGRTCVWCGLPDCGPRYFDVPCLVKGEFFESWWHRQNREVQAVARDPRIDLEWPAPNTICHGCARMNRPAGRCPICDAYQAPLLLAMVRDKLNTIRQLAENTVADMEESRTDHGNAEQVALREILKLSA